MTHSPTSTFQVPFLVVLFNPIIKRLLRTGVPMGPMTLLTVRGRKTGRPYTTPVGLFKLGRRRYLFSTFGQANWVRNLRVTHEATLTHGRHQERLATAELSPEQAAPVLKDALAPYLASFFGRQMLRSYYGVTPGAAPNDFTAVARNHPVFELCEPQSAGHTT